MELLVNIDVDDLERGIRFYTEALGLRLGRRLGKDFAELLGLATPLYLLVARAGSAPPMRPAGSSARAPGPRRDGAPVPGPSAARRRAR